MTVGLTDHHRPGRDRARSSTGRAELPQWLWLWFPPLILVLAAALRGYDDALYRAWIESEQGLVENLTALVLIPAIGFGLVAFRRRGALPAWWLGPWLLLLVAGSVYIALEELSWGQQWFGWATPDWAAAVNDQGETNLHNTSSWLDQKPRSLFLVWVVVAGLVVPYLARRKGWSFDPRRDWRHWFWPSPIVVPTACLAVLIRIPDYLGEAFATLAPYLLVFRYAEYQEYFYALFLLLYLGSFHVRLKRVAAQRS
jgi:hypothetical protein